MDAIPGTGAIVVEPDWGSLFADDLDLGAAREHWRIITNELRERNLLAPVNGHAIQRLVCARVLYDCCLRQVAEAGSVTRPSPTNEKAIARVSPHHTAMRELGNDAAQLEAELGLSPRRRGAVTKVERKAKAARASDAYLKPVASR